MSKPARFLSNLMQEQNAYRESGQAIEDLFRERYTSDSLLEFIDMDEGGEIRTKQSGWGALYLVVSGGIKVEVHGVTRDRVTQGGCVVIPNGRGHRVLACEQSRVFRNRVSNNAHLLPGMLPPVIFLTSREVQDTECLPQLLQSLQQLECREGPIEQMMKCRLAEVLAMTLLLRVLEHVDAPIEELMEEGFDGRIKSAITAIHRDPDRPWTVESLAREVNLSRSSFASRFRNVVGEAPMQYVTRIRINLASSYLQSLDWSISDIAQEVGYKSEGAFIHAFKRQMNTSPGRFRRLTRAQNTSM